MENEVTKLLGQLVAIDSVNPSLIEGAAGESAIASFIADWLAREGVEVEPVESAPGRPSVLGRVRGAGGGHALILCGHVDTVGIAGMDAPFEPVVRDAKLYGRGACDMKSGLAAVMMATARVARGTRPRGDVWIMAVADEEYESIGAQAVLRRLMETHAQIDGCVVTEPTDLKLCTAHRGFGCATITTRGRAAHSSRRDEGIDAIAHRGRVVVALEQFDNDLQMQATHPLLGHGSLVTSLINGGSELFTYPAQCQLELVRRTLPSDSAASVTGELEHILKTQRAADKEFDATLNLDLYRAALETSTDAPIVKTLNAAIAQVLGAKPIPAGASFWTDAALIAEAGIPSVVFGPRGEGLHSDVEWADLPSVQACSDILFQTALQFCK